MDIAVKEKLSSDEEYIYNDLCHGTVEILEFEQRLILETMDQDVVFIHARVIGAACLIYLSAILLSKIGDSQYTEHSPPTVLKNLNDQNCLERRLRTFFRGLGVERMFLNHLIMYSDEKLLTIVLNTSPLDEVLICCSIFEHSKVISLMFLSFWSYFISRLKLANVSCLPKVVNADVSIKDRESVYLEGGVQFLTSRVFLVDLLTDRAPVNSIACIMVYRAHQVLSSFQESFILRLYRERKPGGFVKAFTDLPTSISSLGQLQRMIDRLYVKNVCLLPRFDAHVKLSLEKSSPMFTELLVDLPPTLRRLHTMLVELLKVCIRELKQCSIADKEATSEEDIVNIAVFGPSSLERQLNERKSFLTDKQHRLLSDLSFLRELLRTAEDMDPASVLTRINALRNDKEALEKSGGWMMSRLTSSLITDIEMLCGYGAFKSRSFVSPPKWMVLGSVLKEIINIPVRSTEISSNGPSVLLLVNNDAVAQQLADLIKNGPDFLVWLSKRSLGTSTGVKEPGRIPYGIASDPPKEMISVLQKDTLVTARAARRRRKVVKLRMQ
ncbi:hypothetical protein DICVIV_03416 [Dictyocaulus viviparus]|uniref:Uncharacterized protein n=1 Tax=Dictyocaulus viviparus TaxID=29172 RepID=A0A0D8Y137_DICVI|nr:hypothetical protein DICVIV_03416 [Dictyocaulus viviparus]